MDSKDSANQSNTKGLNINIDISGDQDAGTAIKSMDLDNQNSGRVGLSKDELMKFANQPFWVRLRNILFATFWILWLSILAAAIGYVVNSPNCVKLAAAQNVNSTTMTNATTAS